MTIVTYMLAETVYFFFVDLARVADAEGVLVLIPPHLGFRSAEHSALACMHGNEGRHTDVDPENCNAIGLRTAFGPMFAILHRRRARWLRLRPRQHHHH